MSWTNGSFATPSPREPNPFRSMGGRAWRPYAVSTGSWQMMRARSSSMPTIRVSTAFFCFKIVPCLVLESIFHLTRFDFNTCFKRQPIRTFLLIDRFHFSLQFMDPDSNRFPRFSFHCVLESGFEPLFELLFFNMRYGSGFGPLSTFFSLHYMFWIRIRTVFQTGISFKSLFVNLLIPRIFLNHMY